MSTPQQPAPGGPEVRVEDLFRHLHQALVQQLIDELASGEPRAEALRQARELLRDNGVTDAGRGAGQASEKLRDLFRALPFPNADAS